MCDRVVAEQACRERDKLKADLDLADQRNLQLVREVDDRHASMETLNQSRIRSDPPHIQIKSLIHHMTVALTRLCAWQGSGAGVP